MATFRLCHRATGQVIPGYRVGSASPDEIALANRRMRESGTPFRYVIDLHAPQRAIETEATTLEASDPQRA